MAQYTLGPKFRLRNRRIPTLWAAGQLVYRSDEGAISAGQNQKQGNSLTLTIAYTGATSAVSTNNADCCNQSITYEAR